MAVTWVASIVTEGVSSGGKRTKTCLLSPTGTYTTGGDALPAAALGLQRVHSLQQVGIPGFATPGISYSLTGTAPAPLIRADVAATGGAGASAEVANATSLTGKVFFCIIEGY